MSREQIDRILNSDLSEFDHSIDSKINSIEEITGKLSQKSNFLAQFQLLLHKELGKIKTLPPDDPPREIIPPSKQTIINIQEQYALNTVQDEVEPPVDASFKKQQNGQEQESLNSSLEQVNLQPFTYPQIKQQQRYQSAKILGHFNAVKMELEQYKLLVTLLKEEIKGQIHYFKALVLKDIELSFYEIISKERQKYEHEIKALNHQITSLKQANQKALAINNPFTDLTFTKLNDQNFLNVTQKLKEYQPSQKLHRTPNAKDTPSSEAVNSEQWKTYRLNLNQNIQLPSKFKANMQKQNFVLPETRALAVGVPPVKTGFGTLKIGNKIIYKGMWKDGKFEGSGKLNWDEYCYEGMFCGGCFEGHGRLQFKEMMYVGKFEGNRASGEGTLEIGGRKIMGIWDKNTLVRMF